MKTAKIGEQDRRNWNSKKRETEKEGTKKERGTKKREQKRKR